MKCHILMLNPPPTDALIAELAQFGQKLTHSLGRPEIDWSWRPTPDDWSLTELVCHLRDVEREVHQPRIAAILSEQQPFMAGVNADSWAETRSYASQAGSMALADYLAARHATVASLRELDDAAWHRHGQHAFFGQTTLQELVFLAVQHDRNHDIQLQKLLNQESA